MLPSCNIAPFLRGLILYNSKKYIVGYSKQVHTLEIDFNLVYQMCKVFTPTRQNYPYNNGKKGVHQVWYDRKRDYIRVQYVFCLFAFNVLRVLHP